MFDSKEISKSEGIALLVNMVKEPNMLYETLAMVSNRYDGKSYAETAKRLISRFDSVLSKQQISTLEINADLADQVSETFAENSIRIKERNSSFSLSHSTRSTRTE